MLTPLGLVLALVLASPALWSVMNGSMPMGAGLLRLVAAFVVVAIGTAILRRVMAPQAPRPEPIEIPRRRRDDDAS